MNHHKIVDCQLLIPRRNRTAFLQEADTALYYIPLAIAYVVIADWSPTLALFATATRRDDRSNPVGPQPMPDPLGVVGSITSHASRSSGMAVCSLDSATLKQCFELGRLVRLTGQE